MARQFASAAVGAWALLAMVTVLCLSPVSARMEQAPSTLAPSPVAPVILSDSNSSVPLTPPPLPSATPANASVPTAPGTNATAPASNSSSSVPTTPPTPPVRPPFPRPADLERKTCELSPEQKKYCDERYLRWRQIPSFCRAERRVQRAKARSAFEAARQVYKEAVRAAKDAEAADKASTDLAVQAVADLRRKEAIRVAREVRRATFKRVREERRRAIRESEANCKKHRARLARKLQKKCSLRRCLQHNCHWSRRNIGVQRQLCSREYVEARYTHRLKIFQARKDDELERARLRLSRRASMKATTSYADRVTIRTIYNEKYATQKALFEDAITKEKQRWLIFKADHATACKMRDAEASSTSTALCALVKSYRYRY